MMLELHQILTNDQVWKFSNSLISQTEAEIPCQLIRIIDSEGPSLNFNMNRFTRWLNVTKS